MLTLGSERSTAPNKMIKGLSINMSQLITKNQLFDDLDDEIKQEFFADVFACIEDINDCALMLEQNHDLDIIDRMFRALHTVKGNCNMVFLEEFVETSHKLEDFFTGIKKGEIDYQNEYGQFAVVVVNSIGKQLEALRKTHVFDLCVLQNLELIIKQIADFPADMRLLNAKKACIAIEDNHFNLTRVLLGAKSSQAFSFENATDLEFFSFISNHLTQADEQHKIFIKITEKVALSLNNQLGNKADDTQLKAALLLLLLSNVIRSKKCKINLCIEQVFMAAGFLKRMSGWSQATKLVLQSLECFDGSGKPYGLKGDQIEPAAQVIGLAFEFGLIVTNNLNLDYKQSLFKAVKQINTQRETRYKSKLIERFNLLIKSEYLTQQQW